MTPEEALRITRELRLLEKPRRYRAAGLDAHRKALLALKAAGAKNDLIAIWLRNQKPAVKATGTKLRGWFKREAEKAALAEKNRDG